MVFPKLRDSPIAPCRRVTQPQTNLILSAELSVLCVSAVRRSCSAESEIPPIPCIHSIPVGMGFHEALDEDNRALTRADDEVLLHNSNSEPPLLNRTKGKHCPGFTAPDAGFMQPPLLYPRVSACRQP